MFHLSITRRDAAALSLLFCAAAKGMAAAPAGAAKVEAKVFDFKNPPAIYGVL